MTGQPVTPYLLSMTSPIKLIEAIQSSGFQASIVIAGGGSGAIHALLSHPGASRFVLDVQIPYNRAAMNEYLGERPDSYCARETVGKMAQKAFDRASGLSGQPIGVAVTAALSTVSTREDRDRAFICFHSRDKIMLETVEFDQQTRAEQEEKLSEMVIALLAQFVS